MPSDGVIVQVLKRGVEEGRPQPSNPNDATTPLKGQEAEAGRVGATGARQARAKTVAMLIVELTNLRPQMFEDESEYRRLQTVYPDFLTFKVSETRRPQGEGSLNSARPGISGLRKKLAAAHHGKQSPTIQDDWKDYKPLRIQTQALTNSHFPPLQPLFHPSRNPSENPISSALESQKKLFSGFIGDAQSEANFEPRNAAGIAGSLVCMRTGIARSRPGDIERGYGGDGAVEQGHAVPGHLGAAGRVQGAGGTPSLVRKLCTWSAGALRGAPPSTTTTSRRTGPGRAPR